MQEGRADLKTAMGRAHIQIAAGADQPAIALADDRIGNADAGLMLIQHLGPKPLKAVIARLDRHDRPGLGVAIDRPAHGRLHIGLQGDQADGLGLEGINRNQHGGFVAPL